MDVLLVAQGFGALGFILGMIAFWQLDDKKLLLLSAAYNTAFLIQYLLLGAYSTSLMVVVLASSIYASAYTKKTRWMLLFIALAFAQWLGL